MRKDTPPSWLMYYVAVIIIACVGLIDSVYLAISHYRNYTDIAYSSFCALSKALNCDTVSQSPWSIFLGLPVAIWGVFSYVFLLMFVIFAHATTHAKQPVWIFICFLSFIYSLGSIFFGYISAVKISSYCIMCILSYGVNFLLFFSSLLIVRRFCNYPLIDGLRQSLREVCDSGILKTGIVILISALSLVYLLLPRYWTYNFTADKVNVASGVTEAGHPWIGARNPKKIIEEYTDYQCFQCKKMHQFLRRLVMMYPEELRLVHRHFPLDKEFNPIISDDLHVGSGRMSLLAIAASGQGAFWMMNDELFDVVSKKKPIITISSLAEKLGLNTEKLQQDMISEKTLKALRDDIQSGLAHHLNGTPSYVIDGEVYSGFIPAEILQFEQ